jgi:hypothetical protein
MSVVRRIRKRPKIFRAREIKKRMGMVALGSWCMALKSRCRSCVLSSLLVRAAIERVGCSGDGGGRSESQQGGEGEEEERVANT